MEIRLKNCKTKDASQIPSLLMKKNTLSKGIFSALSHQIVRNGIILDDCQKGAFVVQVAFDLLKEDDGLVNAEQIILQHLKSDEKRCVNLINTIVWNVHTWDSSHKVPSKSLDQRALQFVALFLSTEELSAFLASMSREERLEMIRYHFGFDGYPEGGYKLMNVLRGVDDEVRAFERMQYSLDGDFNAAKNGLYMILNDLITVKVRDANIPLISKHEREDFEKVQISHEIALHFKNNFGSFLHAVQKFVHFFGLYRITPSFDKFKPNKIMAICDFSKELLFNEFSFISPGINIKFYQRDSLLKSIMDHMFALENPFLYLEGLKKMVIGLPTSGKLLSEYPFVDSMCRNAIDFEAFIKENLIALDENSSQFMVIIDQSDADVFNANSRYLTTINCSFLNIIHVSKEQAELLADKMGILNSISDWGYGAARNSVFFLAPVISSFFASSSSIVFDEILQAPADVLLEIFNHNVLQSKDMAVFMGDDDTFIPISLYLDHLLNCQRIIDEKIVKTAIRIGRDTGTIDFVHPFSFAYHEYAKDFAIKWKSTSFSTLMDGSVSVPRFCSPTMMPGEEATDGSKQAEFSILPIPSIHYCGSRLPIIKDVLSTSPFMMDYDYLRKRTSSSFLGYYLNFSLPHVKDPGMTLVENVEKFVANYTFSAAFYLNSLRKMWTDDIEPYTEEWVQNIVDNLHTGKHLNLEITFIKDFNLFYSDFVADGKRLKQILNLFLNGLELPDQSTGMMSKGLVYFLKTYAGRAVPKRLSQIKEYLI